MKIHILVGTMTGTAQLCAQEMELALDDGETQVTLGTLRRSLRGGISVRF